MRRGHVLVVVSGIAALLAGLSLAFVARMRSDAEESAWILREAQARIMLVAACNYIQEASRLGLDDGTNPASHPEGFGWIDVRDGKLGPKATATGSDDDSRFPVGVARRFPMHVRARPPFALTRTVACNPIDTDENAADFGLPLLRNPDPAKPPIAWADFERGDATPRPQSTSLAWFRLRRVAGARFVVTAGGGATEGFRSYGEAGAADRFPDQAAFDDARAAEVLQWWMVEWSPTVADASYGCLHNESDFDNYSWWSFNPTHSPSNSSQPQPRNPVGTIRWVQRLVFEPTDW